MEAARDPLSTSEFEAPRSIQSPKLPPVMLPSPMGIVLGPLSARDSRRNDSGTAAARPPMPWFVPGVVALVATNSLVAIPAECR